MSEFHQQQQQESLPLLEESNLEDVECIYHVADFHDKIIHKDNLPKNFFNDSLSLKLIPIQLPKIDKETLKICRLCGCKGRGLIAPCKCTGRATWIHRKCLDTWRAVSTDPADFMDCYNCNQPFVIMKNQKNLLKAKKRFRFMALRDLFILSIIFLILTGICVGLVEIFAFSLDPISDLLNPQWSKGWRRGVLDAVLGFALFSLIMLTCGSWVSLTNLCRCFCCAPRLHPTKLGCGYYYSVCW